MLTVLKITCPSLGVAESLADLVDGYCRLLQPDNQSIWNRKGNTLFLFSSHNPSAN